MSGPQIALVAIALLVAYANGANDNFKGVATLYGGGTLSYGKALSIATFATLLGSLASLYVAADLLKSFHGIGLVPASLAGNIHFLLATSAGAATTVLAAVFFGIPISTTHALLGAMLGGAIASGATPRWAALDDHFVAPLLFSPLAVIPISVAANLAVAPLVPAPSAPDGTCICVGSEPVACAPVQNNAASGIAMLTLTVASQSECSERYADTVVRLNLDRAWDSLHVLSAAAVSFARGINDTPKMVALLVMLPAIGAQRITGLIAVLIALGGLFNARRVGETMSRQIATLDPRRGLAANLATAFMVLVASRWGMPVSTTHVSCGALFGVGVLSGSARWRTIRDIIIAWVVTLPAAAVASAVAILVFH